MTRVKLGQRKRTKAAKVRSGCKTCKGRHVKCDETRPACLRCITSHRECSGYDDHCVLNTLPLANGKLIPTSISQEPSLFSFRSSLEVRSFQYFTERSLAHLRGSFSGGLWDDSIVRLALFEPCLLQGVLALSSFHELFNNRNLAQSPSPAWKLSDFMTAGLPFDLTAFALMSYNDAIRNLLTLATSKNSRASEIYLISCIMFISIESLKGDHKSAIELLVRGMKVLRQVERERSCTKDTRNQILPTSILRWSLVRLEIQISELLGHERMGRQMEIHFDDYRPPSTGSFNSLQDARDSLFAFWYHRGAQHLDCDPEGWQAARQDLDDWTSAFETWTQYRPELKTADEWHGAAVIQVQKAYLEAELMRNERPQTEHTYRRENQIYERLIRNAEAVIARDQSLGQVYTADCGILGPLFVICRRGRNPELRRKAWSLLRVSNRREGIWDGQLAAQIIGTIMSVEEKSRGSSLDECAAYDDPHPVIEVEITYEQEKTARLRYFQRQVHGLTGPGARTEVMSIS